MYAIALFSMGLQAIVNLAVGVRLLALARRTRRFPELALSTQTLLLTAIGYPLTMLAVLLERLQLPGVAPLYFVAVTVIMVGLSMNYFFTWRVFRPDSAWAVILCAVGTSLLLAPVGGVIAHTAKSGIDKGIQEASAFTIPLVSSVLIAFAWTSVESFRYFLSSRRRLRLGLVEAPVCNRFLLWALGSGVWLGMGVLAAFLLMLGVNPLGNGLFTLGVGASGLLNSACMTLCFMPSESYLDWLRRRAAAMQGA